MSAKEKDAAVAEATTVGPTTITVKWNGQDWEIPGPTLDDAPALAVAALEQGRPVSFVQAALGPSQWRKFASGNRATAGDAAEFMTAIIEGGYKANLGG